jgi:hypothetical protein
VIDDIGGVSRFVRGLLEQNCCRREVAVI